MSEENVEIVRGVYEAWQRGDFEVALEPFQEDIEWFGPPEGRGSGEGVRGREGGPTIFCGLHRHLD
jgi:ketosteroid isomerase-like protein